MSTRVKVKPMNSYFFLQATVAMFFLFLGIYGVVPEIQESVFTLWDANRTLEIVFGLFELCSSLVLIAGLFMYTRRKMLYTASLIIFGFWAARIVISKFILGLTVRRGSFYFSQGFSNWILILIVELIILVAIFHINRRYTYY